MIIEILFTIGFCYAAYLLVLWGFKFLVYLIQTLIWVAVFFPKSYIELCRFLADDDSIW